MIEPITLTVTELAARWKCTTRQAFEQATHLRLFLYFPFDGFAYDVQEERRRTYEELKENEEIGILVSSMEASHERLRRHAAGEVSEWEDSLSDEDVKSLQRARSLQAIQLDILGVLAKSRQAERDSSRYLGDLIAPPETVALCEKNGFAPFPEIAYHPAGKFTLTNADDGQYLILDGRMLRLGERHDSRNTLGADDLRARMVDIKAVEAVLALVAVERPAAPTSPAPSIKLRDTGNKIDALNPNTESYVVPWELREPERYQGYAKPLYDVLKAAHDTHGRLPKARDILDIWKQNKPPEVMEVLSDGIKYYDSNNNAKEIGVRSVQKTIDRLARLAPDSPAWRPTRPTS